MIRKRVSATYKKELIFQDKFMESGDMWMRSRAGKVIWATSMVVVALAAESLAAQPVITADIVRDAVQPSGHDVILLPGHEGVAAKAKVAPEQWFWTWDQMGVRNVVQPSLTVVPPKPGTANGGAIIVAPGGGFAYLSWSNEGEPAAKALADQGVTVFILKYRTRPMPRDKAGYAAYIRRQMAAAHEKTRRFTVSSPEAEADARQAIRYVRGNAGRWQLDPKRIGYLGFSAGAIAGLSAATSPNPEDRPDFVGLIYGPQRSASVPASPPPLFLARAADDFLYEPVSGSLEDNFGLLGDWQRSGGAVELHFYGAGGHGFGMQKNGKTSEGLMDQFSRWLRAQGVLQTLHP